MPSACNTFQALHDFVPQQCREKEGGRHRLVRDDALVGVAQRKHDEALSERLLDDDVQHRQQSVMQSLLAQPVHAHGGVAREQELHHLVEEPRRRHVLQKVREWLDGAAGRRIQFQPELRREARRAQHPHRILAITLLRIADDAQTLALEIAPAATVVDDLLRAWIVEQRVDGEVTPQCVLFLRSPHVVAQQAAVSVLRRRIARLPGGAAKGRHLDRLGAAQTVDDLKTAADDARAAECGAHLLRSRIGRHVEILGAAPEQKIAHCTADDERLETPLLQRGRDLARAIADAAAGDPVRLEGDDDRILRTCAARENAMQELADHGCVA